MSFSYFSDQLLNPSARELWTNSLSTNDRVLITGATGWFGQTAIHLMRESKEIPILPLASKSRSFDSIGFSYFVNRWDLNLIKEFRPTVVIDCAFLTKEQVTNEDIEKYISTNELLTSQLLELTSLSSVRRVITVSSGAAMYPIDAIQGTILENPYGYLKRKAELSLEQISRETKTNAIVARAWSVSGAFIGKSKKYAMSDMIIAAATSDEIIIQAPHKVFRRYVAVEDLLALSLAQSDKCQFDVIDSEGDLLEMHDLAQKVCEVINPKSTITRVKMTAQRSNEYYSRTSRWPELCDFWGFVPESIDNQIYRSYLGLKMSGVV